MEQKEGFEEIITNISPNLMEDRVLLHTSRINRKMASVKERSAKQQGQHPREE